MKYLQSITAATLSVVLLGSMAVPTFAESSSSSKEEVIYVMTDASGKVKDMEAVNIFSGGNIIDYGAYSSVKMLNTNDEITLDGEKILFSSDADRVYYQGTMKKKVIPWNISIRYFLDGQEYEADELAGKSGTLEIRFSVSKNGGCRGSFYEDYALQASFSLDTDICKNITSDGATVADVGNDKQLTYIILPGKGIDTTICAEVTDFEMDAVTINGIRMNMNIEIDDEELMNKADELSSAVESIDDGAIQVRDGADSIYDATETLNTKAGELNTGVGDLASGAGDLYSGLLSITESNDQLTAAAYSTYEELCNAAAESINSQLAAYGMEAITLTPSTYTEVLTNLVDMLGTDAAGQILELQAQLDNYGTFYQGILDYTSAVTDAASGAETLKTNMDTLSSSTETLADSTGELKDAASQLYDGTSELADGTSELADETSDLDTQISDEIDSMTSSITGGDSETVSFISEKNTNVSSVQFIIKTEAIEKEQTDVSDTEEETTLTFWQKVQDLFGWD